MHKIIDAHERKPAFNIAFLVAIFLLVVILLGSSSALSWYVDSLWFKALGYGRLPACAHPARERTDDHSDAGRTGAPRRAAADAAR